jgi:ComEC/Rec2-related protein
VESGAWREQGENEVSSYNLIILLAFLAGVACASFALPFWATSVAGIAVLAWLVRVQHRTFLAAFCIGAIFLFGFFYYFFYENVKAAYAILPEGVNATFTGIVRDEPRIMERAMRFALSLENPYRGTLTVLLPPRDVRYGDRVSLRGAIIREEGEYVARFPSFEVLERHKGFWLKEALLNVKAAAMEGFKHTMAESNAALLAGITLGARADFSPEFKEAMVRSGTIHIVAVSGYNIGILAIAVGNIAMFFLARRYAIWLAIALILLFVGMVGTEASVVRAALMGIMVLIAERAGRPADQAYAITIAATLMAAWDPTILKHDLGFILSFASLLGVVYLAPALQSLWRKPADHGLLKWKENLDTTIGAQLAVLPVLLTVFGKASASSIAANILIIPLIPLTMATGFFLGAANAISPLLGFPLAKFAELLTDYEIAVIYFFSEYMAPIGNFLASPAAMFVYYGFLLAFIAHRTKRAPINQASWSTSPNA